jgi:hypothetical protein
MSTIKDTKTTTTTTKPPANIGEDVKKNEPL